MIPWIISVMVSMGAAEAEKEAGIRAPEEFPVVRELPDPFVMNTGERVSGKEQWPSRRKEIADLLLGYEYGHMPPAPDNLRAESVETKLTLEGKATATTFVLSMGPEPRFRMHCGLLAPATGGPKFPVIIAIDPVWQEHVIPTAAQVIERGYAFAGFIYHDVDNDNADRSDGVYPFYPGYDWATLAAWAWASMRLTDYLCTLDSIDTDHMVVTGHSRTGKAALLAGALDERIALTAPHGSGAGGSGSFRIQPKDVETLALITDPTRFHYWFHPRLAGFAGKEDRLPFDQHFLKALVAPRALLSLDARGDIWSNPYGTQQTNMAAAPVFEFLGAKEKIAMFCREGGHDMIPEDWAVLLDFADYLFKNAPRPAWADILPFPKAKRAYSWSMPK
ncbi:MAG TPA: hypothetical protein PLI09_11455 [Candidatus Hydrogenedentes bacterium]|nr:hypothetical protein [Candidatus Hydrogenedentota bacterium]